LRLIQVQNSLDAVLDVIGPDLRKLFRGESFVFDDAFQANIGAEVAVG